MRHFIFSILMILTLSACGSGDMLERLFEMSVSPQVDRVAPDISFVTYDGEEHALSDFQGQVIVLNFWASWAGPSRIEAPILQSAWEAYQPDDVIFIGIASYDHAPSAIEFINEYGITYLTAPDMGSLSVDAYGVQGVPETFIIGRDGLIVYHHTGILTDDILIDGIEQALAGSTS